MCLANYVTHSIPYYLFVYILGLQLTTEKDLNWLRDKLCVGKTKKQANQHFRDKIEESLRCERTLMNTFAHLMKHR